MASTPMFQWSPTEIRDAGTRAIDLIADHLTTLRERPVFQPVPPSLVAESETTTLPQATPLADLWREVETRVLAYPFGNGHPRFFGWVNSPPAIIGVLASALAAAINPSVAGGNHGAVYIEREVLAWFKQILGFPTEAGGLLVSGGSAGALTALTVARHRACARRGWNVRTRGLQGDHPQPRLVVYSGSQAHSCHQKAVELLGIGREHIRTVPSDEGLRLRPDALDEMIVSDLARGHVPVAVIASAGTVNTGMIDPLDAIADVCEHHQVWLHIDGAYGAPAILLPEYASVLAAIARADSVVLDPHKWLYVPVDAGLLLVKDASAMRDAFSLVPPYLRTDGHEHGVQGPPWFAEFGFEQSRPFRALKIWMALKYFGVDGYRELLAHDVECARHLAERVRGTPELELWSPCDLSIVCFRLRPADGESSEAIDTLNRRVLEHVQLGGRAFLSSTLLAERFWLRACVVNPRATPADVDELVDAVRHASRSLT